VVDACRSWLTFVALALVVGCASAPEEDAGWPEPPPLEVIAPITTQTPSDPIEAEALEALERGDYEVAGERYRLLANTDLSASRRAEFTYLSGECAFARKDYYQAYRLYSDLLKDYPRTRHFSKVVDRVFTVARLFAQGVAEKPSWLAGVNMTDREFGVEILEKFQKARERHPLADDALHYKALALHAMGDLEDAIATWEALAREYPESEWTETARYRIARTMYELSDGPEYDKAPLRSALASLRAYERRYPNGDHVQDAREQIAEIEEMLAGHLLEIAEYYLRHDETYSATIYLTAIDREFPETDAAKVAVELNRSIPKASPPPPPPDPEGLEGPPANSVDRNRLPPPPPAGSNDGPGD
jgi:outer membrane assembly lipoprotein YfiO